AVEIVGAQPVKLHRPEDVGHPGVRLEAQREAAGEIRHGLVPLPPGDSLVAEPLHLADHGLDRLPGVDRVRSEGYGEWCGVPAGIEEALDGVGETELVSDDGAEPAVKSAPTAEDHVHDLRGVEVGVAPAQPSRLAP